MTRRVDRPETFRARGIAAALALATALMVWSAAPAGAVRGEAAPVLAKSTKKAKTKSRTSGFAVRRWAPGAGARKASPVQVAIRTARAQLGKPYRWAGTGPAGFDCSGLVGFAYRSAGVALPRSSRAQFAGVKRVRLEELRPGDLVFSGGRRVNHVGLYIGDGKMIHSPHSGRRVEVAPLRRNLIGAARPTA